MAKKKQPTKRQRELLEQWKRYDQRHRAEMHASGVRMEALLDKAEADYVRAALQMGGPDTAACQRYARRLFKSLASSLETSVIDGIAGAWSLANEKNDKLVSTLYGDAAPARYLDPHKEALEAFKAREKAGMRLSDRVWNLTDQFKTELELAVETGIKDGVSADRMSRAVRGYLNEPHRLFRRVRTPAGRSVCQRQRRRITRAGACTAAATRTPSA